MIPATVPAADATATLAVRRHIGVHGTKSSYLAAYSDGPVACIATLAAEARVVLRLPPPSASLHAPLQPSFSWQPPPRSSVDPPHLVMYWHDAVYVIEVQELSGGAYRCEQVQEIPSTSLLVAVCWLGPYVRRHSARRVVGTDRLLAIGSCGNGAFLALTRNRKTAYFGSLHRSDSGHARSSLHGRVSDSSARCEHCRIRIHEHGLAESSTEGPSIGCISSCWSFVIGSLSVCLLWSLSRLDRGFMSCVSAVGKTPLTAFLARRPRRCTTRLSLP